jgi:hypothetical protein
MRLTFFSCAHSVEAESKDTSDFFFFFRRLFFFVCESQLHGLYQSPNPKSPRGQVLGAALGRVRPRMLLMSCDGDRYFTLAEAERGLRL